MAQVVQSCPRLQKPSFVLRPVRSLFSSYSLQLSPSTSTSSKQNLTQTRRKERLKALARHLPILFHSLRLLFLGTRARELLVFLSSFGRLYEKLLSRHQKSQIWTLRLASPFPSASSHRHIGNPNPIPRPLPKQKPTKRLRSSPNSPKPDGKVNTLLSLSPPNRFLLAESNALAKKRSVLRVKKNVTAVPVSRNSSTKKSTLLSVKTRDGMSDFTTSLAPWCCSILHVFYLFADRMRRVRNGLRNHSSPGQGSSLSLMLIRWNMSKSMSPITCDGSNCRFPPPEHFLRSPIFTFAFLNSAGHNPHSSQALRPHESPQPSQFITSHLTTHRLTSHPYPCTLPRQPPQLGWAPNLLLLHIPGPLVRLSLLA